MGKWAIYFTKNGYGCINSNGFCFESEVGIYFEENKITLPYKVEKNRFHFEKNIFLELFFETMDDGILAIEMKVSNASMEDLALYDILLLNNVTIPQNYNKIYVSDKSMTGRNDICDLTNTKYYSHACLGLTQRDGKNALLFGFENLADAMYCFNVENKIVSACCPREGVAIKAGTTYAPARLLVGQSESLTNLLLKYGKITGANMNARVGKPIKTGWCSWYYYYGDENPEDIFANVEELANSPLKNYVKVIQIDDGWNLPDKTHSRVWGDWLPDGYFKDKMKEIVEYIHRQGFDAGLWLAPFSVAKNSKLYKEKPEWLIKSDEDSGLLDLAEQGGICGLDLTHPEVLEFLYETFKRVFDEWNFDYIKIDFLMHGLIKGRHYNESKTTVEAFREAMKVIRRAAGDKFILNCGSPIGPSIGLCDGMRIGYDVGSRWFYPMNLEEWPQGNCNILSAAYPTIYRQWMHENWWQNDPDCLVVRDAPSPHEYRPFKVRGNEALSLEEAGFWTRLVWFTGTMGLISEVWSQLPDERKNFLTKVFPINKQKVNVFDWYEKHGVAMLLSKEEKLQIGLFNMTDESVNIALTAYSFGITNWQFKEAFDGDMFSGKGESIEFPELPAHAGRVWEMEL